MEVKDKLENIIFIIILDNGFEVSVVGGVVFMKMWLKYVGYY